MNMKIAYLFGSLNRGGAETLMLDVFKNADLVKFDLLGVYRKGGDLLQDFLSTENEMLYLSPRGWFDIVYLFKLRTLLRQKKVNIIHALQYLDAFYAFIACWGTKIKIVQTLHGYDNQNSTKKNRLLSFIIKVTDKNIFVSKIQKRYFVNKYKLKKDKQVVVYNGISFDKLDKAGDPLPSFPGDSDLLLGTVGNFVVGRDQMTICRFLKILFRHNIDFQFVFVGARSKTHPWLYDDCVKYCLENGFSDRVHFVGGRNDVPAILKKLDAFIYSSDHDTFGISVIEAIASGTPTFINDWDVMMEISQNGRLANVYSTKKEEDLFALFMLFLQNKAKFKEKSVKAAAEVREYYSIENHMKELEKLYKNILFC